MCSHGIATDYYLESVVSLRMNNACRFLAFEWDRTFDSALKILEKRRETESCSECPEMGIGASKEKGTGCFLVFTGITAPHCSEYTNRLTGIDFLFNYSTFNM